MTTFIDFWIRGVEGQAIDNRAVAETELVDFLAALKPEDPRPLVHLNGDLDWLSASIPPEWNADLLETLAKYPAADYYLFSFEIPFWQQRMKAVARLNSPGGHIARDWLDGRHPAGIHLGAPSPHYRLLSAIPQAPPLPYVPGKVDDFDNPPPLPPSPSSRRRPLGFFS